MKREVGILIAPVGNRGDCDSSAVNSAIALEVGQRFAIREGNKTIGAGQVLKILK